MAIQLPIKRIIFYKHGVGFFEREGELENVHELKLSFKKKDMDDLLKSLVVLDKHPEGGVLSISYDTPEDISKLLAERSINLSKEHSLVDLLASLRGFAIEINTKNKLYDAIIVGVDLMSNAENIGDYYLTIYLPKEKKTVSFSMDKIIEFKIKDETALKDLEFFLEKSTYERKKDEKSVTVHLKGDKHDLMVSYIASAPTWKVSYRLVYDSEKKKALILGWGIVNNTLDEDLEDVYLVLMTGQPISFLYNLFIPKFVKRPVIAEEERTPSAPAVLEQIAGKKKSKKRARKQQVTEKAMYFGAEIAEEIEGDYPMAQSFNIQQLAGATTVAAVGGKMGQFFRYTIENPVTVRRGQSAMVPIIGDFVDCAKEHVYTAKKGNKNPYVTMKFTNTTGLIMETGPLTVLEDGVYVGEAILPFVSLDQENHIPYAIDVEITIKEEEQYWDEFHSLYFSSDTYYVNNNLFYRQVYNIRERKYIIDNQSAEEVNLIVEHPPYDKNYKLYDTPEPEEKTLNYHRWRLVIPAQTKIELIIKERGLVYRNEYYSDLTIKRLDEWLGSDYVDESAYKKLESLVLLFRKQNKLQKQLEELEKERKRIFEKQKVVQGQLSVLGDRDSEAKLRERYVRAIEEQENRLEAIEKEKEEIKKKMEKLEEEIAEAIHNLATESEGKPKKPKKKQSKKKGSKKQGQK